LTDIDYIQDLFDTWTMTSKIGAAVGVEEYLAVRHSLRDLGPKRDTDARHIAQCIDRLRVAFGSSLLWQFIDTENTDPGTGLDDVWSHWCPCPSGLSAEKADVPAGTIPLWTNGTDSVFCRKSTDKHGNIDLLFGCKKCGEA